MPTRAHHKRFVLRHLQRNRDIAFNHAINDHRGVGDVIEERIKDDAIFVIRWVAGQHNPALQARLRLHHLHSRQLVARKVIIRLLVPMSEPFSIVGAFFGVLMRHVSSFFVE